MDSRSKIGEQDLRQLEAAGALRGARIYRTEAGYVLAVIVGNVAMEMTVHSYRGHPRAWASMDRLLSHLAEVAPSLTYIELLLSGPSNERG